MCISSIISVIYKTLRKALSFISASALSRSLTKTVNKITWVNGLGKFSKTACKFSSRTAASD